MDKLITMTDLVLQSVIDKDLEESTLKQLSLNYNRLKTYAEILRTPLDVSMFVPCNENGDVIEGDIDQEKRSKAMEDMLFDGFRVDMLNDTKTISDGYLHVFWYDKITMRWVASRGLIVVENLTPYRPSLIPNRIFGE